MAKLKENEYSITLKDVDNLLDIASEKGIEFEVFEGTLLDNYIIYSDGELGFEGNNSKYILIDVRFVNTWTSELILITTDSDEEVEEFKSRFERDIKMYYYEINFYGEGHENDWSFYIKSEKDLSFREIKNKLKNEFLGIDGLEVHHIENIVSVDRLTPEQFTAFCGIKA